ncbi:MAG: hypothetical protein ACLFTL_02825 [Alphaproteobacteria bacterium]
MTADWPPLGLLVRAGAALDMTVSPALSARLMAPRRRPLVAVDGARWPPARAASMRSKSLERE